LQKTKASENPFNPSFGRVPPVFLDRENTIDKVTEGLKNINSPYQTTLIYGLRGSGKTAIMTDICNNFRDDKKWIVVNLAPTGDMLQVLVSSIYSQAESGVKKLIKNITGVKVSLPGLQIEYRQQGNTSPSYQIILEEILKVLKEKGISLLIAIDEVTASSEIREFASIYQIMIRNGYQVGLIMTGLPKHISELLNDNVLTFLMRSARVNLKPLDLFVVREAYRKAFNGGGRSIGDDVLLKVTRMSDGYAYAFQLLGYLLWESGQGAITDDVLDEITPEFKLQLYRNVYTKIFEDMSSKDREFVFAMAEGEKVNGTSDVEAAYISKTLDKPANYLANYRKRLMDSQVISSKGYGIVRFTLPFFGEYLRDLKLLYG